MKRTLIIAALTVALAEVTFAASAPSSQQSSSSSSATRPARAQGYSDRYGLLEERNIFLRDRSRRSTGRNGNNSGTTQPAAARRPVEESFVLNGVVLEDAGYRAYFENPVQGETLRLAAGESLAHGKVGAIAIDGIAYDVAGGQRTWVAIGCDLTGKPSMLLSGSTSSSADAAASTQPTISADVAKLNPNDPNLTQEQRMKLKRASELQKKP
jgi:hypothetical protein